MLMATPGNDPETSILLTQSNACYSFDNQFVENISNHRLRGNVWEIVHIRPRTQKCGGGSKTTMVFDWDKLPLCVEQHLSPLEKFYIITSKVNFYPSYSHLFKNLGNLRVRSPISVGTISTHFDSIWK